MTGAVLESGRKPGWRVTLDRTAFYPEGGGQPADHGTIAGVEVIDVQKEGDEVSHLCAAKAGSDIAARLSPGQEVECLLDWERRYDYMQQHTGQHIVSAALKKVADWNTVSVHLGDQTVTVEIDVADPSAKLVEEAEALANEAVCDNRPVLTMFTEDPEVIARLRRKPQREGVLRIVEVKGFDLSACGGVHVGRSGEVGLVKACGMETIRGRARIHWKVGGRAFSDYDQSRRIVQKLVDEFSAPAEKVVDAVISLRERESEKRTELGRLSRRYAEAVAGLLAGSAGEERIVTRRMDGEGAEFLKLAASALREAGVSSCLADGAEGRVNWCIGVREGVSFDFEAAKAKLFEAVEGRGGGRHPVWQGGGRHPEGIEALFAEFIAVIRESSGGGGTGDKSR